MSPPGVAAERVCAWRLRRQFLAARDAPGPVEIARRLVGVQAQVPSGAAQAVAVRTPAGTPGATVDDGAVDAALAAGTLLRTWAVRGTLHLLAADQAPAVLALLAAARTWEKGAWQREFATAAQVAALAEAATAALADAVLTREELAHALVAHSREPGLAAALGSGWGAVLKPLAWQGLLCHGPPAGTRVTFTSPARIVRGWSGLPDPDEAARTVVPAYLAAYGPATPAVFDARLLRGATPKARLRRWFADLVADGALTEVEVDGERRYARTRDVDDLLGQGDADGLRLLGPFDPYVLGPGTNDPDLVPPAHRRAVSRAAGWIARVVLDAGRVVGTWTVEDDRLTVAPFDEPVAPAALAGERVVWSRVLGRELTVPV